MKIFYTAQAISDLKRFRDFIASDNPKAASDVSEKIIQAINRLCDFPTLGREVKPIKGTNSLRDLITGKYIVRYAVIKTELHILRLWHTKEQRELFISRTIRNEAHAQDI